MPKASVLAKMVKPWERRDSARNSVLGWGVLVSLSNVGRAVARSRTDVCGDAS